MKNLFVPYDLAVKANKVLDCKYFGYFDETLFEKNELIFFPGASISYLHTNAPLYSQLIQWFQEKHNLVIRIHDDGFKWEIFKIGESELKLLWSNLDEALHGAFRIIETV